MSFDFRMEGDVAVLVPKGDLLGGAETDALRAKIRQLAEADNRKLVIDLGKTTYMNSLGIGMFMETYANYTRRGAQIRLCRLDKMIKQIFAIVKLSLVFGDVDFNSVEEAIASFTAASEPETQPSVEEAKA